MFNDSLLKEQVKLDHKYQTSIPIVNVLQSRFLRAHSQI